MENSLRAKYVPFQIDEKFRSELLEHYPIIYCSTVDGKPKVEGLDHERTYDEEMYLETVKLIFIPEENKSKLQTKLEEIGLANAMQVHGYKLLSIAPVQSQKMSEEEQEKLAFLDSVLVDHLMDLTHKKPHLMKDKQLIKEKLSLCFNDYSTGKGNEHLSIANWLLKNANEPMLAELDELMTVHPIFTLHKILQFKSQKNGNYLPIIKNIVPNDYLDRLKEVAYLKALLDIRQKKLMHLLDYHNKSTPKELFENIHPKHLSGDQKKYLYEYLLRLQSIHAVLSRDIAESIEYAENITELQSLVREKYVEIVNEYNKKNVVDDRITNSELFQLVKDSVQSHQKTWIRIFSRSRAAATG